MPIIPDAERRSTYNPSSPSAGPYSIGFSLGALTDVEVYQDGVLLDADGYTVAGTLSASGLYEAATVTLDAAFAGQLDIIGHRAPRRETQFTEGVGIPARDQNLALNRVVIQTRDVYDTINRSHAPIADRDLVDRAGILVLTADQVADAEAAAAEALAQRVLADSARAGAEEAADEAEGARSGAEDAEDAAGNYADDADASASSAASSAAAALSSANEAAAAAGGLRWTSPVLVAAAGNVALSGEQTIDGELTSTSRVLAFGQTAPAENGIYVTAAGAWTRATDADTGAELPRLACLVQAGTVYEGAQFACVNALGSVTLGTTAVLFVQTGVTGIYTADEDTIELTGTQFAAGAALIADIADRASLSDVADQAFAGPITAPYILPEFRGLKISEFVTTNDYLVDSKAQLKESILAMHDDARYVAVDLEGKRIGVDGIMDLSELDSGTGQDMFISTGVFHALTDTTATSVSLTAARTVNVATLTVADNSTVNIGDHVAGDGIPRECYVVAKPTSTTITMSRKAYSTNASFSATFTNFPCMFDMSGAVQVVNLAWKDVTFSLRGLIGGIKTVNDQGGRDYYYNCRWKSVKYRGVCSPMPRTESFFHCRADSTEIVSDGAGGFRAAYPSERTHIFCNPGGDGKMYGCQITDFLHVAVTPSQIQYKHNHNFQGHGTDNSRTAQLVLQGRATDVAISHNYLDNSWIEVTDECAAGVNAETPLGWIIMTGNRCSFGPTNGYDAGDAFAWLKIRPFVSDQLIANIIVEGNLFQNVNSDADMNRAVQLVSGSPGSVSAVTPPNRIYIRNNLTRHVKRITETRPTRTVTVATAATTWNIFFTQNGTANSEPLFPFGMPIRRVLGVEVSRLLDSSDVAQYDRPQIKFGADDGLDPDQVRLTWASPRKGTAVITVDCNTDDPA